ncbi:DNA-3-methyladenine glycosylase 2 family protein [Bacillus salacetis]|uniref:DNA-3-methyladenine glycosylase II n=1 Tax=Bacillus salacetis TaxID=2315464 RepID=A0A3A1QZA8_9BACI|nr:DNA-3-methyladenine glycosylase [Bacillus salacetis]RIW34626.1 DNA-3-methyladenine glycosylase 2 family protein [Bacillus salacetis]
MKWKDQGSFIEIFPPADFSFQECLIFLGRSHQEILHRISEGYLYKLIKADDQQILLKIGAAPHSIKVEFPISEPNQNIREKAADYLLEWFDMDRELKGFYQMAASDEILQAVCANHFGLRIIGIPDLFEALTWAVIGQQINLTFAYTLKKRFVEHYGECLDYEGIVYWLYPEPDIIAELEVEDLRKLQFTNRKAEYIIGIAKSMKAGLLAKKELLQAEDYPQLKETLMKIRGIGGWTADYVMMKCLKHPRSFPIADVGLHNAIKLQKGMERKPTIREIEDMAENWKGWEAYAVFYLWRSLYE